MKNRVKLIHVITIKTTLFCIIALSHPPITIRHYRISYSYKPKACMMLIYITIIICMRIVKEGITYLHRIIEDKIITLVLVGDAIHSTILLTHVASRRFHVREVFITGCMLYLISLPVDYGVTL